MKFKQWQYTSCEFGLSGYAGFQTCSKSLDIDEQLQRKLEKIGGYQRPRTDESDDASLSDLPVAFRSMVLESGELLIVRSNYTGRDYSGRSGNFFAHGLVGDFAGQFEQTQSWAIDYCQWDEWKTDLTEQDKQSQDSYELAEIEVPELVVNTFEQLAAFIKEQENGLSYFKQMLGAIIQGKQEQRTLVIRCHSHQQGLMWLACLQKAFAPQYQTELSFSSYQYEPQSNFALNVTYPNTEFSMDENEREYQFFAYDFIEQRFSQPATIQSDYIEYVTDCYGDDGQKLAHFFEFAAKFSHNQLDQSLEQLYWLYCIAQGEAKDITETQIGAMLDFVGDHCKQACYVEVASVVGRLANKVIDSSKPEVLSALSGYFIRVLQTHQGATVNAHLYRLIAKLKQSYWLGNDGLAEVIDELTTKALKLTGKQHDFMLKCLLGEAGVEFVVDNLTQIGSEKIQAFYMQLSELAQGKELYKTNEFKRLFSVLINHFIGDETTYPWLFAPFSITVEAIEVCLEQVSNLAIQHESLLLFIHQKLRSFQAQQTSELYVQLLANKKLKTLLLAEFKHSVKEAKSKEQYFAQYQSAVLNDNGVERETKADFYGVYWQLLSSKEQLKTAISWLQSDKDTLLLARFARELYQLINQQISFNPKDNLSEQIEEKLKQRLLDASIQLTPDCLYLNELVKQKDYFESISRQKLNAAMRGLDEDQYKAFVKYYFEPGLQALSAQNMPPLNHLSLLNNTYYSSYREVLFDSYRTALKPKNAKRLDNAFITATIFWLGFKRDENLWCDQGFIEQVLKFIATQVLSLKEQGKSQFYQAIQNHSEQTHLNQHRTEQLNQYIREKDNTLLRRTLRGANQLSSKAGRWVVDKLIQFKGK